ncbi:hypothetical protein NDJ36_09460 [Vibrio alginolyticus]|nr:hypothetical protein [Vibrio alginolyticus]
MKRKLTKAQRELKRKIRLERKKRFKTVLINGKQVRIKREPEIEGLSINEFLSRNDPFYSVSDEFLGEADSLTSSDDDISDLWE